MRSRQLRDAVPKSTILAYISATVFAVVCFAASLILVLLTGKLVYEVIRFFAIFSVSSFLGAIFLWNAMSLKLHLKTELQNKLNQHD
eukprot:CAMPEP_0114517068 /NCGR_PEP_ID=MMETSP0109-20121206/17688_1 /TAXON_ID=29199 /ORGANISM="Chlorarachnion reptans, Strain CCCM449" /LENGTH=86 /DNA_ID=CAMNT_0001697547 /DNA_START=185 /DNA_END=445 /DNA_ORIENTATION=+